MREVSQKLQCLQNNKLLCPKNAGVVPKRDEQLRIEAEKVHAEIEDNGQQIQAQSLVEAEADLEMAG